MVTVLYSSSVYSRETDEHVRRRRVVSDARHRLYKYDCASLFSISVAIHVLKHTPANLFILFPHASLHLGIDYLDNRTKEETLQKVGTRGVQD